MSRRPPGRAEIVSLLAEHGISPSRALGQNFVTDPNLVERVARLAGVGPGDRVVEIGAGLGSLTVALAATGADVLAIEIDRYLTPVLRELVEPLGVTVVQADAMSCDWAELLGHGRQARAGESGEAASQAELPWVLVANLPYNIATPLVADLLEGVPSIVRMLVMVQREVGERLAAAPGSRTYGAVSVKVAYFAEARVVTRVPADVFLPRPNVESVLIEIVRRPVAAVPSEVASFGEIDRLVRAGFSGRRKMLRRSLAGLVTEAAFAAAGVESTRRPEELGVETWGKLAEWQRRIGRGEEPPPSS
jgi:16S rRNA (adenine1518-N6/adenine1519-N6)-dimethyltransferase